MDTKDFTCKVKAAGEADGLEEGQFEAIVSVFGNKDSVGDVVMPGAFTDDLQSWGEKGDPIPVLWSHDWADPFSHIGSTLLAQEVEEGLKIRAQLDLDNPKAMQVYRLLKGRRVTQFSFAYDVIEGGWAKREGEEQEVYELRKLHVFEVGPTLVGANQATELLTVKASELARSVKAGRTISTKNFDQLVAARDALDAVISASPTEEPDTEQTSTAPVVDETKEPSQAAPVPADTDEPAEAKASAEGPGHAPRRALAVARIATL